MASEFGVSPQTTSNSGNAGNGGDAKNFECNICFDLAQDPIITLCGHLYCWPCLYRWLHIHSLTQQCPVCKGLIEEEKLVPLYGRGKNSTDPRSKSIPGLDIPHRPTGQRPETAPAPPPDNPNPFAHHGHGFGFDHGFGGFAPAPTARFGNFTLSGAFGVLQPFFNIQVHGVPDPGMYGAAGLPYGFNVFGHAHGFHHRVRVNHQQPADYLKILCWFVGFAVLFFLLR